MLKVYNTQHYEKAFSSSLLIARHKFVGVFHVQKGQNGVFVFRRETRATANVWQKPKTILPLKWGLGGCTKKNTRVQEILCTSPNRA